MRRQTLSRNLQLGILSLNSFRAASNSPQSLVYSFCSIQSLFTIAQLKNSRSSKGIFSIRNMPEGEVGELRQQLDSLEQYVSNDATTRPVGDAGNRWVLAQTGLSKLRDWIRLASSEPKQFCAAI